MCECERAHRTTASFAAQSLITYKYDMNKAYQNKKSLLFFINLGDNFE